jgi:hypothetical protein
VLFLWLFPPSLVRASAGEKNRRVEIKSDFGPLVPLPVPGFLDGVG